MEEFVKKSKDKKKNKKQQAEDLTPKTGRKKKQEEKVLTFTFDQPKLLDQMKIRLKPDAPSDQRFEVQFGGFRESNSIPPGSTGTFAVQKGQSAQEAVISGETDWIEKVEIFGFNEEKK